MRLWNGNDSLANKLVCSALCRQKSAVEPHTDSSLNSLLLGGHGTILIVFLHATLKHSPSPSGQQHFFFLNEDNYDFAHKYVNVHIQGSQSLTQASGGRL